MINAFKEKGLVPKEADKDKNKAYEVDVILLMHKMKVTFDLNVANVNGVTGAKIAEEVEDLGFGAELIGEHRVQKKSEGDEEMGRAAADDANKVK